jgi:hypothetical protein
MQTKNTVKRWSVERSNVAIVAGRSTGATAPGASHCYAVAGRSTGATAPGR